MRAPGWLAAAGCLLAALPARADGPQSGYSGYEQQSIDQALALKHAAVDPVPEGKLIESIEVVALPVIEPRDPAPGFVNLFHATSRAYVIRREVLQDVGARYRQALLDETAFNLRNLPQLSLVVVVPLVGSAPDRVRVLVLTKDVWSLRLNNDFTYASGKLLTLLLEPTEENLFGTHQTVNGRFAFDPATYQVGGGYTMPRVAGSHLQLHADAAVILGRETGAVEGSKGSFQYGQPLYSTLAEWSWMTNVAWRSDIARRFVAGVLVDYVSPLAAQDNAIPWTFKRSEVAGSIDLTRSFGGALKNDVSVGFAASQDVYRTFDLSGFAPAAAADFVRTVVPVSDTVIGPYVEYHTYSTTLMHALDLETLGLREDRRVGHDVYVKLLPATTALRSSRNFLGVAGGAQYTVPLGGNGGLLRAFVESITELTADGVPDGSIEVGYRLATPSFVLGRLVFDGDVLNRYKNYLNSLSSLGGDTRLRGYPAAVFVGKDYVANNLEFRTRRLDVLSCEVGGALFLDSGDAFTGFSAIRLKQSAGFGLRVLFPQLQRTVLRADWGFPLTRLAPTEPGYVPPGGLPGDISVTFGQAFSMPSLL